MAQFIEFIGNHPYLFSAAVILAITAVAVELRARGAGGLTLPATDAVRAVNRGGLILDLRPAETFGGGHLAGARNVAMGELPGMAEELKKYLAKPVLVVCETGSESVRAARALRSSGFEQAYALHGGISGWRRENLPLVEG